MAKKTSEKVIKPLTLNDYSDDDDENKDEKDPLEEAEKKAVCNRLTKTFLLNVSFLALGVCEAIKGPTLLDLQDLYEVELDTISFLFVVECFGSLAGSFLTGYLMSTYPQRQSLILFVEMSLLGLSTALTPWAPNLFMFFFLLFFVGFLVASVHTGGNILCLELWSGSELCGPHIHSIHFFYAFGAFLSPVLSTPFLSTKALVSHHNHSSSNDNSTSAEDISTHGTRITTLYPLVGLVTIVVSYGYLHFCLEQLCSKKKKLPGFIRLQSTTDGHVVSSQPEAEGEKQELTAEYLATVAAFTLFLFLYVGIEYCFGTYLSEFAVNSSLKLSRAQGANLTAVFWGCFSLMRFLAIFAVLRVKATHILVFSFVVCFAGSVATILLAEHSFQALQACSGVLGFGMGTVFATGLAWLEQYITVTTGVGAILVIAGTVGPDIFPVVVGQFLERTPMVLVYAAFMTVTVCIGLFMLVALMAKRVRMQRMQQKSVR